VYGTNFDQWFPEVRRGLQCHLLWHQGLDGVVSAYVDLPYWLWFPLVCPINEPTSKTVTSGSLRWGCRADAAIFSTDWPLPVPMAVMVASLQGALWGPSSEHVRPTRRPLRAAMQHVSVHVQQTKDSHCPRFLNARHTVCLCVCCVACRSTGGTATGTSGVPVCSSLWASQPCCSAGTCLTTAAHRQSRSLVCDHIVSLQRWQVLGCTGSQGAVGRPCWLLATQAAMVGPVL
jgi:hypothetical protein